MCNVCSLQIKNYVFSVPVCHIYVKCLKMNKNCKICRKYRKKSDPTDKFYKLRTIWGRITDIWSSLTGFTALSDKKSFYQPRFLMDAYFSSYASLPPLFTTLRFNPSKHSFEFLKSSIAQVGKFKSLNPFFLLEPFSLGNNRSSYRSTTRIYKW